MDYSLIIMFFSYWWWIFSILYWPKKGNKKFVLLFGSPLYCDDHMDAFFVTCRCCNLFISMVWVWRAVLAASPVQRLVHTTGGEGGSCIWRGLSENKWCPYSHTNCSPTIGWRWCGIQFSNAKFVHLQWTGLACSGHHHLKPAVS